MLYLVKVGGDKGNAEETEAEKEEGKCRYHS